ncbi:MAG: DUF2914 domain-containing protein [Desulfobacterium sp.]|nr:DUF2914 domain-containing protein [Desulfobacterium sp.]
MVEEKDQLLLKKMREALKKKELLNKEERIREEESEKKPAWQRPGFWVVILCAGFILSGLMIFKKPSPIIASNSPAQGTEAAVEESKAMVATKNPDPIAVADDREKAPVLVAVADTKEKAPVLVAVAENKKMAPVLATHGKETPPSMEIDLPEKEALLQRDAPRVFEEIPSPEIPAEQKAAVQPGPTEQMRISSGIRISEIVSCSRITQRQYSSPQKVFSLKKDATAAIWMNVVSEENPFTLTHVYYVNGRRYCAVPLEIQYQSMRTWSNVTLGHPSHIGEWRVEVMTDKGEKLDQIAFTVVP